MERWNITLDVTLIASGEDDAKHLAEILRARLADLMGNGQATVAVTEVEPA